MLSGLAPRNSATLLRFASDTHHHHDHADCTHEHHQPASLSDTLAVGTAEPPEKKPPAIPAKPAAPARWLTGCLTGVLQPFQSALRWGKELLSGFWKDLRLLLKAKS